MHAPQPNKTLMLTPHTLEGGGSSAAALFDAAQHNVGR
jgi:hypothetical protein